MKNRICTILATALFAIGLLAGCKAPTPLEATTSAVDETRMLIKEHVADEAKAEQLIALVDQLEKDLLAYREIRAAHDQALCAKNADYDATREDLEKLYDAYNKDTRAIGMQIALTDSAMKKLSTPEEWALISDTSNRIGGF